MSLCVSSEPNFSAGSLILKEINFRNLELTETATAPVQDIIKLNQRRVKDYSIWSAIIQNQYFHGCTLGTAYCIDVAMKEHGTTPRLIMATVAATSLGLATTALFLTTFGMGNALIGAATTLTMMPFADTTMAAKSDYIHLVLGDLEGALRKGASSETTLYSENSEKVEIRQDLTSADKQIIAVALSRVKETCVRSLPESVLPVFTFERIDTYMKHLSVAS